MATQVMNLLLVGDNPGDAGLLREMTKEQTAYNVVVMHVETVPEVERHVADQAVDVIVLDLGLPDASGLKVLRRIHAAVPLVPILVLTGVDDEAVAMQALQEGAQDYMIKGQINTRGLLRALRHAIERKTLDARINNDLIVLKRAEAELREREMMLQLALDVSQQGVWRWEIGQDRLQWDERCMALFGQTSGKPVNYAVWANAVHADDRVAAEAGVALALDPERAIDEYSDEYRVVMADGTIRWVASSGRGIFEPDPAVASGRRAVRILGTIRDVSPAKRAEHEREMQNSMQRLLAKVFMSVDDAVAIVNGTGRIVMANPCADRLLGYKPNQLIGKSSMELLAPEARAAAAESIKQQFAQGSDVTYDAPVLRADGTRLLATMTSVLVATDDMKQFRIVTVRANATSTTGIRTESAGRIQLLGLDEVRLALGDRWPKVAERAMATAEAVLKKRCGPQDSYSRVDDTSFLVCFGGLSETESTFRAATIGREIRDRLIGQGSDPETAYVRSIAASIRFPDLGETGAALNATLVDGLDKQLGRLEVAARQTLRGALASAACTLIRVSGGKKTDTVATQVALPRELERALIGALCVLPQKEAKAFDQDGMLIGLAAQHAIDTMARGEVTPILVNVRFDVFATRPATERYVATCLKIDQRVSSRLILLLSALPEGLPKTRLLECVNRLRPFCRGVGFQVNDVAGLAHIDLSYSTTPVVSLPASALVTDDPNKVKALFASLQARRARILVRDVVSDEDAAAFRSQGANMIAMESRNPGTSEGRGQLVA